jgi:hypothetical protein
MGTKVAKHLSSLPIADKNTDTKVLYSLREERDGKRDEVSRADSTASMNAEEETSDKQRQTGTLADALVRSLQHVDHLFVKCLGPRMTVTRKLPCISYV